MKIIIALALMCSVVWAETFESRVVRVSDNFVYWENGRVTQVDDEALLDELENSDVLLRVEELGSSTGVQSLSARVGEEDSTSLSLASYEPTVLESEGGADAFFKYARRPSPWQWSWQCYNIAHVRSYEEFKRTGLKSMKIFLFFSDRYIREYNFKWWFHVTPMTYVKTASGVEERIIDKEWMDGPVGMRTWTNNFMKNKAECKRIQSYSQYEDHQEEEYCYLFPANMYYWQPKDLAESERTRKDRTEFDMSEVRWAYKKDM